MKVKGRSASIRYDGDNQKTLVTAKHVKRLCLDFLQGNVDQYFVSYIADALLISENSVYESESVNNLLESLTEFSIKEPLTVSEVQSIYNNL